jgi:hypothetical protein
MPGGMNGDELAEAAFAAKPTLKSCSPQAIPAPAVARPSAWLKEAKYGVRFREILDQ